MNLDMWDLVVSSTIGRRMVTRMFANKDIRMIKGAGAGLRFNSSSSDLAYTLGDSEIPVQEALIQQLRPGDVFYDIGANVGFFTVIGARLVGSSGRVYAFEPVPSNASAIRHNVAMNGFTQVELQEKAVAQTSGQAELLLAHCSGGASLRGTSVPPDLKGQMIVQTAAIDDLVEAQQIAPPDVVKIDVEGAELQVLEGMARTIQTFRPIILYEIDDGDLTNFTKKQSGCAQFLGDRGYEITHLDPSYPNQSWIVGNFVALPKAPLSRERRETRSVA